MIQNSEMRILANFYDRELASFVELCRAADYPSDLGGYYIRRLVRLGYLEKAERGVYRITPSGKQELALQYGKKSSTLHPRFAVLLVCKHRGAYMLVQRTVQPFIGRYEWPAGMVAAGESVDVAARRIAIDRVGVQLPDNIVAGGMFRRIDRYHDELFDDKVFVVHAVELETLPPSNHAGATGKVIAATQHKLMSLPNKARSLLDILEFSESKTTGVTEHTYTLTLDDLASVPISVE